MIYNHQFSGDARKKIQKISRYQKIIDYLSLAQKLSRILLCFIACEYDEQIVNQLAHCTKLKHLTIKDYQLGLLQKIRSSPGLNSVCLEYCYRNETSQNWLEFLENHPNIRKICINHSIDFLDDNVLEIIAKTCNDNLEYFIVHDCVAKSVTVNGEKSFQRHCPKLKILQLTDNKNIEVTQNNNQKFHNLLANIKCVIFFYLICIILFTTLVFLMIFEKI